MADWTANSGFGATREPVFRTRREPNLRSEDPLAQTPRSEPRLRGEAARPEPRPESLRAEPWSSPEPAAPRLRPGAAALAQYNAAAHGPLAKARYAIWAGGGVLSLLLIGGVGIWGYKLVLREVMGLPIIAAETGPMRVLPSDPEGEIVPSQGLAVNTIPAAGTAAAPSDLLVLAPQTPGLAEEDMEVVQTNAEAGEVMPAAPVVSAVAADPLALVEVGTAPAAQPLAEAAAQAVAELPAAPALPAAPLTASAPMTLTEVMALADRVSAQVQPVLPVAAAPVEAVALAPAAAPDLTAPPALEGAMAATLAAPATELPAQAVAAVAAALPSVVASLRPAPRPTGLGASPAPTLASATIEAPAEAAPPAPAAPVTPAASGLALTPDLPAGTNLVQLGAFDSPEIAAAEWTRLQGRFGEFLGGRERVIQETQSNGRTFYRLRAMGFADRADARILCAALTAENAACIPVTVD